MSGRKLRLEIKQSNDNGECESSRVPRWHGHNAITTNDITGSVMKILVTDSKGKQISITIGNNGSIRELNEDTEMETGHGTWMNPNCSQNETNLNSNDNVFPHLQENNQRAVTGTENTLQTSVNESCDLNLPIKTELKEYEELATEASISFNEVVGVTSEGYNSDTIEPDVEDEFRLEMNAIKIEEANLAGQFETVYLNSETSPANDEAPKCERNSEFSRAIVESTINETATKSSRCRLCAIQRKDMIDIFGPNEAYKNIIEKIEDCLPILVKRTDALPQQVCRLCLEKLELFYRFRKSVAEAEKQLTIPEVKISDEFRNTEKYGETFSLCNVQLNAEKPVQELVSNEKTSSLSTIKTPKSSNSSTKKIRKDNDDKDIIFVGKETIPQPALQYDIIKCRICGRFFGTPKSCVKHSEIHASENYYPCSMCDTMFTNKVDSLRHGQVHTAPKLHQLRAATYDKHTCSYNLRSKATNRSSSSTEEVEAEKDKADVDIMRAEGAIENQTSIVQNDNDRDMIKCRICGKYFGTAKSCYTHSKIHTSENIYPCSMCDKVFTNEKDSCEHSLEHVTHKKQPTKAAIYKLYISNPQSPPITTSDRLPNNAEETAEEDKVDANIIRGEELVNNKTFTEQSSKSDEIKCRICGVIFPNAQICYAHSSIHAKENYHPCTICYKIFTTKRAAYRHHSLEHITIDLKDKQFILFHSCNVCGKKFVNVDRLQFHKIYYHQKQKPSHCIKCSQFMASESAMYHHMVTAHNFPKEYKCNICHKQFEGQLQLNGHKSKHANRPYGCSLCKSSFFSNDKLILHRLQHCRSSLNKKNFSCVYCGKSFLRNWSLINHVRQHTGERPYRCDFCPKSYLTSQSKNKHQLSHTDIGRHKCSVCEKRFFDIREMKIHENIHSENRPYNCSFCDKSFKQEKTRREHIRAVHTGDKRYQCNLCGKQFMRPSTMRIHKRTQHELK